MTRLLLPLAGAVMVSLVALEIFVRLGNVRARYHNGAPLPLPGASRMHLPPSQAANLVRVSEALRNNCTTFVTLPGMNSFYFWAEREPPTAFNSTSWMYLFGPEIQLQIVGRIQGVDRLCVVRSRRVLNFWKQGRRLPPGPLIDYLNENFYIAAAYPPYQILKRSRGLR